MKLTILTSLGNIGIEVYPDKAPMTVENFVGYVKSGFYKNTIFHRTVPNFVIQGGGFDVNGDPKWPRQPAIPNESNNGLYNTPYSVAMARLAETSDSATCEFFINVVENMALNYQDPEFNPGYCVFGKVIIGFEVVDKIAQVKTQSRGPYTHLPVEPVIIHDVVFTDETPEIPDYSLMASNESAAKEAPSSPNTGLESESESIANLTPESEIEKTDEDVFQEEAIDYPVVRLSTNMGDIDIALFPEKAPLTVKNFLEYVEDGFYVGTIFHRVIEGFVIQGGGYTARLRSQKRRPPIPFEGDNGLSNQAYTIAMARAQELDSASSEFFINLGDNQPLDHTERQYDTGGYCVFGMVVDGFDVVDRISQVPVEARDMHEHVPIKPVVIEKAYLKTDDDQKD